MAVTLTVGTNSWVSVTEADTYFNEKYGASAWAAIVADDKKRLLITACNWIRQQTELSIEMSATDITIKHAQFELAWFVRNYYEDFDKHRAMSASGITSWKALDASEALLGNFKAFPNFPEFILEMLTGYTTDSENAFPRVSRDVEENGSA